MNKIQNKKSNKMTFVLFGVFIFLSLLVAVYIKMKFELRNGDVETFPRGGKQLGGINRGNCLADDCLQVQDLTYPVAGLTPVAKTALEEAIQDEYKALATYEAVLAKFGQVRPFSMIKGAEEQHVASLKNLFDKYGLPVPQNSWNEKVSVPETLQKACQTGVEAEIANAKLYKEKLLPQVADFADLTTVFQQLMSASQLKHLPAFERCN